MKNNLDLFNSQCLGVCLPLDLEMANVSFLKMDFKGLCSFVNGVEYLVVSAASIHRHVLSLPKPAKINEWD